MNADIKYIPEDIAQYLTSKVKIMDVITDLTGITPKRSGANYFMLCPFHDDHTANNFSINEGRNIWHCFKCDDGGNPIDFIMKYKNWSYKDALIYIADLYNVAIPQDSNRSQRRKAVESSRPKPVAPTEEKPKTYGNIPSEEIKKYRGNNSIFAKFLYSVFDADKVSKALELYQVGTKGNDLRTIFWYIDTEGVCREGKVIKYDANGHRNKDKRKDKTPIYPPYELARNTYHVKDRKTCLFGENLLKGCNSTIALAEAEKTALIMSICLPGLTWVSCGGETNLNKDMWQALKGHKVLVFPDANAVSAWTDKVKQMQDDGINAHLQLKWMSHAVSADGGKYDIADIYLRLLQKSRARQNNSNAEKKPLSTFTRDTYPTSCTPDVLLGLNDNFTYSLMVEDSKHLKDGMPF